MALPCG